MTDQRGLIEAEEWDNLVIFDACRFDSFESIYPNYLDGDLKRVHNGGETYTYDWFKHVFRKKYDATFYDASLFDMRKQKDEGWRYSDHFERVVGPDEIDFDFDMGTSLPDETNKAVRNDDWEGERIIRYLTPHPPFSSMPWTKGAGKIGRGYTKLKKGTITPREIRKAYEENVRIAFKGVVDLIPDLKGGTVITSDHGECLYEGNCNQLFHAKGFDNHPHLVNVPWFKVGGVKIEDLSDYGL